MDKATERFNKQMRDLAHVSILANGQGDYLCVNIVDNEGEGYAVFFADGPEMYPTLTDALDAVQGKA